MVILVLVFRITQTIFMIPLLLNDLFGMVIEFYEILYIFEIIVKVQLTAL